MQISDELVNVLTTILAILAVVGLSEMIAFVRYSRRFSREHLYLRFQSKEPIDIVLTTSERTEGGVGVTYRRPTTAVGNLKGAAEVSRAIGDLAGRRSITVHLSEDVDSPLCGDLVLLGGPNKNQITALCLEHLLERHPETNLVYIDHREQGCRVGLGDFETVYELSLQDGKDIPSTDYAIVALWVNPLSTRKRRLLVCAGFTAYATAAAAHYAVGDFMRDRYPKLRGKHGIRSWPCFLLALEFRLANDQVVEIVERQFVELPDPGIPPFAPPTAVVDGQIGAISGPLPDA